MAVHLAPSLPILFDVRAATLRELVKRGQRAFPDRAARLARAGALALLGDIMPLPGEPRAFLVTSERDPTRQYRVEAPHVQGQEKTCDCKDWRNGDSPGGWCKHLLAIALLLAADDAETSARLFEEELRRDWAALAVEEGAYDA